MASSATGLLTTCLGMFGASVLGGFLPRFFQSPKLLDKIGVFGAGLLVGTALCVILPEGFEALHSLEESGAALPEWSAGAMLLAGFAAMIVLDFGSHAVFGDNAAHEIDRVRDSGVGHTCSSPLTSLTARRPSTSSISHHTHHHYHDHPAACEPHPAGALSAEATSDPEAGLLRHHSRPPTPPAGAAVAAAPRARAAAAGGAGWQVLCGLLVHSAADGLAVGAASMATSTAVTLTVAMAMVAHKAPVAFGLTSFLTSQARWRRDQVLQGLLAFSLAAPLVAVATWAAIHALPAAASAPSVALALLFSGGTFLYAATIHVLPGVLHPSKHLSWLQLSAALAGCVLPLVFASALPHHHHH